jgi:hypothetical protein
MKEAFDSATNAEFIRFLHYAKQSKAQSGTYVILDQSTVNPACRPAGRREPLAQTYFQGVGFKTDIFK